MKELMNQMFSIILRFILYEIFWSDKINITESKKGKAITALFGSLSIILCMSFPFASSSGFIYDLRYIPLVLITLYAGYEVCLLVSLIMFGYRYIIGGDGFYLSVIIMIFVIPFILFWVPRFRTCNPKKRVMMGVLVSFGVAVIDLIVSIAWIPDLFGKEIISYILLSIPFVTIGMAITISLIERIKQNNAIQQQLREAEKLKVVSQLASSIAHEVRNPLTVVRGFIQLFIEGNTTPDKRQQYSKIMLEELERAQFIIDDYLSFARPEIGRIEVIDVNSIVSNATNIMSSYATANGVDIVQNLDENLYLQADKRKLTQVIVNIAKNAVEAMPHSGTLEFRTETRNDEILIHIIDEGIGMSQEQIERLGFPFYSTKDKGTGLGMMVSFQIVRMMNGRIQVQSELGKGTQFSILLPRWKEGT
ncbi:ATP-binding protein [Ammoniphilus sp. CFH 90114]|uniref:ATP-binding protein n=1 Tax=Ammoniphilus sp. CFH 90114 TaxID=2493665 RepID=UPI0013E8FB36|nr:ATP-binding protein [Ammoniphilus sp. CFH 90114]